ncbi:MAG: FtsK/SpoIIIE domain-containing protein, partial [Planctomycetota bacterium]
MREGLFTGGLRDAFRELVALNAERAETEASVARDFEEATAAARVALEEAERAAAAEYQARSTALETDARTRIEQIEAEHDDEDRKTRRTYDVEIATIEEKAGHSSGQATKKLDDAIWAAETVFEATQEQPAEQCARDMRVLDGKLEDLTDVEEEAMEALRRYRLPAPDRDAAPADTEPDAGGDDDGDDADPTDALDDALAAARAALDELAGLRLPRLFVGLLLPTLVLLLVAAAAVVTLWLNDWRPATSVLAAPGAVLVACVIGAVAAHAAARAATRPIVGRLQAAVDAGRRVHDRGRRWAERKRETHATELRTRRDRDRAAARSKYEPILEEIDRRRDGHLERIHGRYPKMLDDLATRRAEALAEVEAGRARRREEIERRRDQDLEAARGRYDRLTADSRRGRDEALAALASRWTETTARIRTVLDETFAADRVLGVGWDDEAWATWTPPTTPAGAVRFGGLDVAMDDLPGGRPAPDGLPAPWPDRFTLPAVLAFPDRCSLLVEAGDDGQDEAVAALQTVMFRLLTTLPPGKVRFTIIDPVGLGQNFAGFMHLADHLEALVTDRIWTETRHIEQRLADLTDHMETVIQKYLRNEYETIAEYNEQAGEIAEPYRFLVIASFPVSFSETAARRLASIVSSGARCGVHTLMTLDTRQTLPPGIELADVRTRAVRLVRDAGGFTWTDEVFGALPLALDPPPDPDFMTERLHAVAEAAKDSSRVEVPFDAVAPGPAACWTAGAAEELRVPLGRSGAARRQELALGRGTAQHVLVAGKTGSGKSTLLHVLVTNLALWYGPDEVELYLVDFKKGVEFKCYATHELPHARAVAIESDREFGLSVLRRLDQELKRRGDRFRAIGVQDLAGFRAAANGEVMPRTLLIVDEFQELFVEDDKIGQDAAMLLDRLVRQGRAFGIHVILGSQTLGGAYSLAKSTMGQMAVRIALQCSESDSYLIFNEDNSAARLL